MLMPEAGVPLMQRHATDMATQVRFIMDHLTTSIPFPYVHLLTALVKIALLILSVDQGERVRFEILTSKNGGYGSHGGAPLIPSPFLFFFWSFSQAGSAILSKDYFWVTLAVIVILAVNFLFQVGSP
jgi:hypothetical protein